MIVFVCLERSIRIVAVFGDPIVVEVGGRGLSVAVAAFERKGDASGGVGLGRCGFSI
jgi:hypothetical protein